MSLNSTEKFSAKLELNTLHNHPVVINHLFNWKIMNDSNITFYSLVLALWNSISLYSIVFIIPLCHFYNIYHCHKFTFMSINVRCHNWDTIKCQQSFNNIMFSMNPTANWRKLFSVKMTCDHSFLKYWHNMSCSVCLFHLCVFVL